MTVSDDGTRLFFAQCYGAGPNGVYQRVLATGVTTPILQGIPGCASNAMDYRDEPLSKDGALYSPRPFEGKVVRVDLATKEVSDVTTGWGVPIAVKFDSQGRLYAANMGNGELVRIDLTNPDTATNREVIARLPVGWFDNFAFDKDDRLYISSGSEATVLEVLPGGKFRTVSPGGFSVAMGLTVLDGTVYTVQPGALFGYNAKTGAEQSTVRSVFGIGPLPAPTTVTTWGDQLVLMSVFTGALMLWDPVTQAPTLLANFKQPVDATAFRGDLIVTEAATGNVVRASGPGLDDREVIATMFGAAGLAATEDDVYVGNAATGKVLQIIADGKVLATPVTVAKGLVSPEGLDLRSNGTKLLVVDGAANTLSEVNLISGKMKTLATDLDFFTDCPRSAVGILQQRRGVQGLHLPQRRRSQRDPQDPRQGEREVSPGGQTGRHPGTPQRPAGGHTMVDGAIAIGLQIGLRPWVRFPDRLPRRCSRPGHGGELHTAPGFVQPGPCRRVDRTVPAGPLPWTTRTRRCVRRVLPMRGTRGGSPTGHVRSSRILGRRRCRSVRGCSGGSRPETLRVVLRSLRRSWVRRCPGRRSGSATGRATGRPPGWAGGSILSPRGGRTPR